MKIIALETRHDGLAGSATVRLTGDELDELAIVINNCRVATVGTTCQKLLMLHDIVSTGDMSAEHANALAVELVAGKGDTVTLEDIEALQAYVDRYMDPTVNGNTDWDGAYARALASMEAMRGLRPQDANKRT